MTKCGVFLDQIPHWKGGDESPVVGTVAKFVWGLWVRGWGGAVDFSVCQVWLCIYACVCGNYSGVFRHGRTSCLQLALEWFRKYWNQILCAHMKTVRVHTHAAKWMWGNINCEETRAREIGPFLAFFNFSVNLQLYQDKIYFKKGLKSHSAWLISRGLYNMWEHFCPFFHVNFYVVKIVLHV